MVIKFNDLNSSLINYDDISSIRVILNQKKLIVFLSGSEYHLNYRTQSMLVKDYTHLLRILEDAEILLELPNDEPIDTNNLWRI